MGEPHGSSLWPRGPGELMERTRAANGNTFWAGVAEGDCLRKMAPQEKNNHSTIRTLRWVSGTSASVLGWSDTMKKYYSFEKR